MNKLITSTKKLNHEKAMKIYILDLRTCSPLLNQLNLLSKWWPIYNSRLGGKSKITINQIRLGNEFTTHQYRIYLRELGVYYSYTTGFRYKKCVGIIQLHVVNTIRCVKE